MKYIILLGDGMSDEPIGELDGKTPLQAAKTPHMDKLAQQGIIGLAETVPAEFHPGSDVANLSVFGYDPASCYTGRSPLEAASMGVDLGPDDVAFRLNLVTLGLAGGDMYMQDFSAGHITTDEARELIECLQEELDDDEFQFYPGVSYRHLMVWRGGRDDFNTPPPHDLTGQSIQDHVLRSDDAMPLMQITNAAQLLFKRHPVNVRREKEGCRELHLALGTGSSSQNADFTGKIQSEWCGDLSRRFDQRDRYLCRSRRHRRARSHGLSGYQLFGKS